MKAKRIATAWLLCGMLHLCACGARRPVLYPNDQYNRVGAGAAERDIEGCMVRAEQFVSSGGREAAAARDVAGHTAVGAAGGAAVGAVGGAITGNAGEGAAVGAATGATAGMLQGLWGMFQPREPEPVYANFVDRCLRERGYEPIGWK